MKARSRQNKTPKTYGFHLLLEQTRDVCVYQECALGRCSCSYQEALRLVIEERPQTAFNTQTLLTPIHLPL
ncbi:MAG: hypothetical protein DRI93_01460 [Aquificota bacterium]|nr:MAG: hypothetical protein DRI93_01460 [Aquificota bacterium]